MSPEKIAPTEGIVYGRYIILLNDSPEGKIVNQALAKAGRPERWRRVKEIKKGNLSVSPRGVWDIEETKLIIDRFQKIKHFEMYGNYFGPHLKDYYEDYPGPTFEESFEVKKGLTQVLIENGALVKDGPRSDYNQAYGRDCKTYKFVFDEDQNKQNSTKNAVCYWEVRNNLENPKIEEISFGSRMDYSNY